MRPIMDAHPRFAKNIGHANRRVALLFKHLHDDCVVRPPAVQRPAADAGDCRELADRVCGILFSGSANRIGYGEFTAYQLKIIQEIVTLIVFAIFAFLYLGEAPRWNYVGSFVCILGAVAFAFWGKV
jgi:Putative member of DMT superfamily (DUF486)